MSNFACVILLCKKSEHYIDIFLHPEEFNYFATLSFDKRKLSYLIGRLAAKQAVAKIDRGNNA